MNSPIAPLGRIIGLSSGDIARLDGCGPLASRVDLLHSATGWPVEVIPAPWGYLLRAEQFVLAAGFRAVVTMKVTHVELCGGAADYGSVAK